MMNLNLINIPAFKDNYIWLLHNGRHCIIVDPGEAGSVIRVLTSNRLTPIAILLTHHHQDHVAGIKKLLQYSYIPIYGPEETRIKGTTHVVNEGHNLVLLDRIFSIIALPGHTLGHIGFYSKPWLFCGDTVFSAGCGKLFEGTPKQMYDSFYKINQLPSNTLICSSHEYTLKNLNFAISLLPQDITIANYQRKIKDLRSKNQSSLPSQLYIERKINIFFRCHDVNIQNKLKITCNNNMQLYTFTALRKKMDSFQET